MAGYFKKILTPWGSQPQELVEIHADYSNLVSSARQWNIPAIVPTENVAKGLGGYSKTGTIDVAVSSAGIGVKGDGSTGLYSRAVSVVPQAMWMAVQFTVNSVTTTQKCVYALGSAGVTTAAYCGIFNGNGTTSELSVQFRAVDASATAISKLALTPVVGTTYTVIAVYPSGLKADAYTYVNGVKYIADSASSTDITFVGASTLVNEAVGALKRGTTAVYGSDTILFTTRGLGQIPESLAKQFSENIYSSLRYQERNVWVPTSAPPTVVTFDPASFNLTAQSHQNAANTALTTSTLNLTGESSQNSTLSTLTAVAFNFAAQDITAENAGTATVTFDAVSFSFVANDIQNTVAGALDVATFDFTPNEVQPLTAHSLDVCTFDFVGQSAQNALNLLLENAIFDFTVNSITFPGLPSTGRATNMMLMGVGN